MCNAYPHPHKLGLAKDMASATTECCIRSQHSLLLRTQHCLEEPICRTMQLLLLLLQHRGRQEAAVPLRVDLRVHQPQLCRRSRRLLRMCRVRGKRLMERHWHVLLRVSSRIYSGGHCPLHVLVDWHDMLRLGSVGLLLPVDRQVSGRRLEGVQQGGMLRADGRLGG